MRFKPLKFKLFSVGGDAQIWIKFAAFTFKFDEPTKPACIFKSAVKRSNLTSNLMKRVQI
ncbi:hypothetical protein [Campylobacter showae]|uniref:Uncharacterized protein n=1 Tax=Campylobacter showae RM3277 TaxID=553219 RepID=C6RIX7_9BACT|nr:hypothetical protein [Campylobacter showae]EET78558.1 hypothetical protein CAMSH0001_0074 [Campylobacter showae RM3277]